MAAPAIGRRPRFLPTNVRPEIDWGHPLAQRLNTLVIPRSASVRDLVNGAVPDVVSSPTTPQPLSIGTGAAFGATDNLVWSTTSKPVLTVPFTAHAVLKNPNAASRTFMGSGLPQGWKFGSTSTATTFVFTYGGVADYTVSSGLPASTAEIAVTVSVTGNTATFYVDGAQIGTATVGTIGTGGSRGLMLGSYWSGASYSEYVQSSIGFAAAWARTLSANEVASLVADPFQMLRF